MTDLRRLIDDPDAVATLTVEERMTLALTLAAFAAALAACPPPTPDPVRPAEPASEPGLLTIDQAAALAGVTAKSFLRRRPFRPAIVRLGHRTVRVEERRLRRILAGLRT